MTAAHSRDHLRADCSRCAALCCTAPTLTRSRDFAIDKPAGVPCPHLAGTACGIHGVLRDRGFPGCVAFDCFGAGQQVVQVTWGGRDPASAAEVAERLRGYETVRDLHELLWYLADALGRPAARPVHGRLGAVEAEIVDLAGGAPDLLTTVDSRALQRRVGTLLAAASRLVRDPQGRELRRADLAGADLRGADLRSADLRGGLLLGADLTGADLRTADLLGADLRGARLHGADLADCLYLTRTQVGSAEGGAGTVLPDAIEPPSHWSA